MKIRQCLFLGALLLAFPLIGVAQYYKDGLRIKNEIFSCTLAKGWWKDGFGSSSVCDCAGYINGLNENSPKIAIYVTDLEGLKEPKRDQVWDDTWDFAGAIRKLPIVNKGGIEFYGHVGKWVGTEKHVVMRFEANNGHDYVRVFVFGTAEVMVAKADEYQVFFESFRWE
jgi:hypothetical protein